MYIFCVPFGAGRQAGGRAGIGSDRHRDRGRGRGQDRGRDRTETEAEVEIEILAERKGGSKTRRWIIP